MNIVSITEGNGYCRVLFGRDGQTMQKHIRMDITMDQFIRTLTRAAREADRDISVMTHGDIAHCEDESANLPGYKVAASA